MTLACRDVVSLETELGILPRALTLWGVPRPAGWGGGSSWFITTQRDQCSFIGSPAARRFIPPRPTTVVGLVTSGLCRSSVRVSTTQSIAEPATDVTDARIFKLSL